MKYKNDPAKQAFVITNSDTEDLPSVSRGLYTGSGGDITVVMADEPNDNNTVPFSGAAAGIVLPICVRRVMATGTTPEDLVALI